MTHHSALLDACQCYNVGACSAAWLKHWLVAHNIVWPWQVARVMNLCGGV